MPTHSTGVLARRASRCPIAVLRCRRLFRVRYMFGDHPRWHGINRGPADFGLRGETVSFTSQDGIALKAWWLPANGTRTRSRYHRHGIDHTRQVMLPRATFLVHVVG